LDDLAEGFLPPVATVLNVTGSLMER